MMSGNRLQRSFAIKQECLEPCGYSAGCSGSKVVVGGGARGTLGCVSLCVCVCGRGLEGILRVRRRTRRAHERLGKHIAKTIEGQGGEHAVKRARVYEGGAGSNSGPKRTPDSRCSFVRHACEDGPGGEPRSVWVRVVGCVGEEGSKWCPGDLEDGGGGEPLGNAGLGHGGGEREVGQGGTSKTQRIEGFGMTENQEPPPCWSARYIGGDGLWNLEGDCWGPGQTSAQRRVTRGGLRCMVCR